MKKILNFESFNEEILSDLSSKIGKALGGIKRSFNRDNPKLKKWNIFPKKVSDTYFQFSHDNRIIADLKLDDNRYGSPTFKLTIYYYDSEVENKDNSALKGKFENQKEQPYAKGNKIFYTTDIAIEFLVSWWSKNTKSGQSKNSNYKIKL